ncbi:hypothetical protein PIB30_022505 [Stylosanthes scabra]|uniref:Aminotransferase-like plant mobile domain-containing protein n=1 Tax=Stylosanthes scabra TaxID=79078 RepID=A0ABU6V854_9FABA|nr:hypothetical protein [Stylosanthes scabra]
MPWGECTITLEDVAYQLGLPIDVELVSGCLWDFENMMPEGTGRPRWDWFREMFGEPPAPLVADQCTVTFSWLRSTFGVLPDHPTDKMVLMHARAYIWMLLLICLFEDKTGAQAHTQGTTIPSTMSSPSQQAFLDGLHSPRFEQLISDIMREGGGGYRPDTQFDGSPVHLDLNERMSGPSHLFIALGGTPPSASHVPGASWDVPFMELACLLTPPVSPAPAEQPAAPGWAGRALHRRGCGTGGHM